MSSCVIIEVIAFIYVFHTDPSIPFNVGNRAIIFQEYGKPVYSYSTNPDRRFSSSTSQHFKMSPPFASSEGVSASGDRLQSDGVQDTHLLPHS